MIVRSTTMNRRNGNIMLGLLHPRHNYRWFGRCANSAVGRWKKRREGDYPRCLFHGNKVVESQRFTGVQRPSRVGFVCAWSAPRSSPSRHSKLPREWRVSTSVDWMTVVEQYEVREEARVMEVDWTRRVRSLVGAAEQGGRSSTTEDTVLDSRMESTAKKDRRNF